MINASIYMLFCGPIFSSINVFLKKYTGFRICVPVNYNFFFGNLDGNEYVVDVLMHIANCKGHYIHISCV
jgi:hypothetical protein